MEKLKQKVAALQENIETSRLNLEKSECEVHKKEEKIEELKENVESHNLQIQTSETDLETAEEELSGLKSERKKMTDDEEDIDRNLRKLHLTTNQSRVGASGLQEKIKSNSEKLMILQTEIEEKENSIHLFEQDLDIAEQNNNTLKEEFIQLEAELVEATNELQSIASSHVTTTGAGGSLRNQVAQRNKTLEKRKTDHNEVSTIVEELLIQRDTLESDIEEASNKLKQIKEECTQVLEELDTI